MIVKINNISLKNKIFLAVLLLILLPLFLIFLYIFNEIESSMKENTSKQAHFEIENMNQKFSGLLSTVLQSFILLNKDATIRNIFENPYGESPLERQFKIEQKMKDIDSAIFLYHSPQVFFTLADFHGNIYTSYRPRESLNYNQFMNELPVKETLENRWINPVNPFTWMVGSNYVHYDYTNSENLLSLYAVLADGDQNVYGIAKIGIDYEMWFTSQVKNSPLFRNFSILSSEHGRIFAYPDLNASTREFFNPDSFQKRDGYITEKDMIINYSYLSDLSWYLVNRIALDQLFADIYSAKRKFLLIYLFIMAVLVLIMLLISSKITRPINNLLNKMTLDINTMVKRLSEEKLQKEAIRFKMLLFQINPHFLLNTLNTVKFIAWKKNNNEISEICVALGTILETSLNSDIELIHLKDELKLIEAYVYILKFRFEDQFTVRYEFNQPELKYALVPKISLQPLVENAVQHGFANLNQGGLIIIRAYSTEKTLIIEVEDNGEGFREHKIKDGTKRPRGIGISNLKERLGIIFPGNAELKIMTLPKGTMVQIALPLMLSKPKQMEDL